MKKNKKEEKRKGGRKPGDRSTAALEAALIFGLQSSAEPDCLKAMNSWICTKQERKAIGQLAKKCLSLGGGGCRKQHCCGTTCGIENTFQASASALEDFGSSH